MTDILMPKLSDSMEQGTIISWLKATGDQVEVGDELLEIETDKATMAYPAEKAGKLELLVAVGTTVSVGEPICRIGPAVSSAVSPNPGPAGSTTPDTPRPTTASDEALQTAEDMGSAVITPPATPKSTGAGTDPVRTDTVKVTPLARRVAAAHAVVLADVRGTGPLGRIIRADVLNAAGLQPATPSTRPHDPARAADELAQEATTSQAARSGARRQVPTRLQQLIVRRMTESKSTIPHFQVQTEVDMGAALALRQEFKMLAVDAHPVPSVNDLIVKAAAIALRSHPLANGSFKDGAFELHEEINIGVAVAADGALVVPVIRNADAKSLSQIAIDTRRLARSVRDQTVSLADLSGGTFTVSNLGMFGVTAITPVINPPEAAILGVGATRATLARVDGAIVDKSVLTLTLSCDHRILYGADAARFLAEIRDLLEAPLRLVL